MATSSCFWSLIALIFLINLAFGGDQDGDTTVPTYTREDFKDHIENKPNFVLFFAPWCGHCQKVLPTWRRLAEQFNKDESKVRIAQVNCVKDTDLCADYNILGYPTMKFFKSDRLEEPVTFKGGRDLETFEQFIKKQMEVEPKEPAYPEPVVKTGLYELTEATFEKHIQHGDHFIKFYAPWCGHCQRLAPTWEKLATFYEVEKPVKIGKVDCTENKALCQKNNVRAYPTLLWYRNGIELEKYQGARDLGSFLEFIKQKTDTMTPQETSRGDEPERIPKTARPDQVFVTKLTAENFETITSGGITFVKFYVDWCGHCKALAPVYRDLGKDFEQISAVKIAEVNCEESADLCSNFQIRGYPTLILFQDGKRLGEYNGARTRQEMSLYVMNQLRKEEL